MFKHCAIHAQHRIILHNYEQKKTVPNFTAQNGINL